jgi:hypothetical protein
MGDAEKQLEAIASASTDWDIPALTELSAAAGKLSEVMGSVMDSTEWAGEAAEGATAAFERLAENFLLVKTTADAVILSLENANGYRVDAATAIDGLSSGQVDPAIVAAARTASAVVFRGMTLPADGAIGIIEGMLGNEREKQAQEQLDKLEGKLAGESTTLRTAADELRDYTPSMPDVAPPVIPDPPTTTYTPPSAPRPVPVTPAYVPPPTITGVGLFPTPVSIDPPVVIGYPVIDHPSVDGDIIGTTPVTVPGGTGGGTFPGGTLPGGSGGADGSGGHGSGSGSGSGGLGAGLIGGGAAAAAAAAAAKARAAAGGSGGGIGRLGAGGLGGSNGVGANGSSAAGGAGGRLGAGGLGGAGGVGAGGATGAAGGAGRLGGGGGMLGSTGGGAASSTSGGNVTTSTAAGAGGRGGGGMMGGGAGGDEKDKRAGLGGLMAPKLDDESDAAPRSEGASAGGRDQQPQD